MSPRGFTLVEVMVVMVIIAILITAVSLSLKGDRVGEALGEEARRLTALLNLAREEAVMRDRDLGLVLADDGYFFVQHDEAVSEDASAAEFTRLTDDTLFRARTLPPGMVLRFETRQSPERRSTSLTPAEGALAPRVLALANDMLWPQGVLNLSHSASTNIERIAIEPDGARLLPQDTP